VETTPQMYLDVRFIIKMSGDGVFTGLSQAAINLDHSRIDSPVILMWVLRCMDWLVRAEARLQ
jgi:hypothetical protein